MGKRLLTSVLSVILILTSIPATGLQVYANEADTVVVSEVENEVETEVSVEESGETMSTEEGEEIADENEVASEEAQSESEEESEEPPVAEKEIEKSETEVEETLSEGVEETVVETESVVETIVEEKLLASSLTTTSDADILYSGEYEDITWTIDECGHLTVKGSGDFAPSSTAWDRAPWYQYASKITSAKINVTGMKDASKMFYCCTQMTSVDLSEFDISEVVNMSGMFMNCYLLKNLDVSKFDTSNVTNMSKMFAGCYSLKSLDVSNFDTGKVTDTSDMFGGCSSLTSLNVSNFNTENVIDMYNMFGGCGALTSLDVSNFNTENVKNMSRMFLGCWSLKKLDISNFNTEQATNMWSMFSGCSSLSELKMDGCDTSNVTEMGSMFEGCISLSRLDVSHFNTGNVTSMTWMFKNCSSLTSLDVSNFNTSNVTDMEGMFEECKSLTNLVLGNIDTSNVKNMSSMFGDCILLKKLDLNHFNTSNVTNMNFMFGHCNSLEELKIDNFDTSNVIYMSEMFFQCFALKKIDLTNFNTENATGMSRIFESCSSLTELNLSSFDMGKAGRPSTWFYGCSKLNKIYTPKNLDETVALPKAKSSDVWYKSDGSKITELPQNLEYSTLICKNKIPTIPDPYITVSKVKTAYDCGDTVNTDDITVTYYDSIGTATKITEGFSTNAEDIDMSTPGKKELVVTYQGLTAKVELTVTVVLVQDEIDISLSKEEYIYNGYERKPVVSVVITASDTLLTPGVDYTVSYENNVNVTTEAKVIITGQNNYRGILEKTFTITPASLTITAKNKLCLFGDVIPTDADFEYRISGLCGTDELITGPFFNCPVTDMNIAGTYTITPYGADAGPNYIITYVDGILTVQEEGMVYSVTYDTMGHGEEVAAITGIKAGSLITVPQEPQAEGYVFGGWYKDKSCTKVWNFETDTVQGDTTLYACWLVAVEEGEYSFSVQDIRDQSYTGNALKPTVRVYAADGSTLLKSGKDYTIKYYNNTLADTEEERGLGGDNSSGVEGEGGFTKNLPYVVITGKGDYSGSVYRNFHIIPAGIGDGLNTAEGITLKYVEQLIVNAKKDQKPLTSLKYKKSMKAGTDYTVTLTALDAKDASGNPLTEGQTVNAGSAPVIPKGYSGHFAMLVEGTGNYTGSIEKDIYVSDKNHLIKNVTITLGKNQKKVVYKDGENITLTPGWYDTKAKKYYKVNADGSLYEEAENNANDIFTVKVGSTYLRYGIDYIVSYKNNNAVGKANMVLSGTGDYSGSKTTSFTIAGQAFNTSNIVVGSEFKTSVTYTGRPQTQNNVTLTTKAGDSLEYGVHYTISYKNNLKKGTASMKFTAKPESGYTGSITKTFKVTAPTLTNAVDVVAVYGEDSIETSGNGTVLIGDVVYRRSGSRPVDRVQLVNKETGDVLKAGTDYSVNYANNKKVTTESIAVDKLPLMTLKGKGNYTGSIKITFRISEASFEEDENVTIKTSAVKYNAGKKDNYQYKPSIKVLDATIPLSLNKDYKLEYINCMQPQVKAYLTALAEGSKTAEELQDMKPKAVITVMEGKGYAKDGSRTIDLPIYMTKFTTSNLYVVVSEENTTYTGAQLTPSIDVYYGDAKAVKAAKSAMEVDEVVLTDESGTYKLTKLSVGNDYSISYGANIKAGKNKGIVTVTGNNLYGGSVTTKFTINSRHVY